MKRPATPAAGTSWEVRSRSTRCAATRAPFQEGDPIYSRLVRRVDGDLREDYSEAAWTSELKAQSLFHWKTKFRLPAPKKEAPFKEENAEEFLRELLEANDTGDTVTLYILALMLERRRILVDRGTQHDPEGRQIRIYEHKDNGETYFIVDPVLDIARIAEVQQEVALRLGWIQPPESETEEASEVNPNE